MAQGENFRLEWTPEYVEKASKRRGGVGHEAMIITGELAEDVQQTKFIPVLRRGAWDKTSMTRWLTARTGADLRGNPYKKTAYERLVMETLAELQRWLVALQYLVADAQHAPTSLN